MAATGAAAMRWTVATAAAAALAAAQAPFVPPNSPIIPSEIWPLPVSMTTGATAAAVDAGIALVCSAGGVETTCPDPLPAAWQRYRNLMFFAGLPAPVSGNVLTAVACTIDAVVPLAYAMNESYTLVVPSAGTVQVTAATQWGALRALESLSQLPVWQGPDAPATAYLITNTPLTVIDAPRFPWRGFLIDTSFNFLSVAAIKGVIDAMSYAKFNILHWHATDDPSWPITSATYPNFTAYGAFSSVAVYSLADQLAIRDYAAERGILILIELDMPGHAQIWKAGNPSYVITCPGGQTLLNPITSSGIYDVIRNLIAEYAARFPGMPFIHLGGDEVSTLRCWNENAAVQAFMAAEGIATVEALREYFTVRVQNIALSLGLRALMWEEVLLNGFTYLNTSVVTPWLTPNCAQLAVNASLHVVNYFSYYLDQQTPPGTDPPNVGPWYYYWVDTWQTFYNYDPVASAGLTPEQAHWVLGGTASLWGENVDAAGAGAQALARAWPRAAATAERLWSPATVTDVASAEARLEHFRCHAAQRGVPAGPLAVGSKYGWCWSPAWAVASSPVGPPADNDDRSHGMSSGAAGGLAVGCIVLGVALAVGTQYLWARRGSAAASGSYSRLPPSRDGGGSGGGGSSDSGGAGAPIIRADAYGSTSGR